MDAVWAAYLNYRRYMCPTRTSIISIYIYTHIHIAILCIYITFIKLIIKIIVHLHSKLFSTVSRQRTPYQSIGQFLCPCAGKFSSHSAIPRFLLCGPGPRGRENKGKRVERPRRLEREDVK